MAGIRSPRLAAMIENLEQRFLLSLTPAYVPAPAVHTAHVHHRHGRAGKPHGGPGHEPGHGHKPKPEVKPGDHGANPVHGAKPSPDPAPTLDVATTNVVSAEKPTHEPGHPPHPDKRGDGPDPEPGPTSTPTPTPTPIPTPTPTPSPTPSPTPTAPTIDAGFNGGQSVSTGFVAESVAAATTGKIYVVGYQGSIAGGTEQSVVQRLNADGSLDTFFGVGGQIISTKGYADEAVAIDSVGRIVTAGSYEGHFAVSRFLPSGRLDLRFGQQGHVFTSLGASDSAYALAIAPDDSIIVAGTSDGAFAFARYLANGAMDRTFGSAGTVRLHADSGSDVVGGVALAPDGHILAVGSEGSNVAVVRLSAAGAPDASFGSGGLEVVPALTTRADLGGSDHTEGIAVQGDGRIVIANRTAGGHFGVIRLNADGSEDASFGNSGLSEISFGGDDDADTVAIQATGQIIVVGTSSAGGGEIAAAALAQDGSLDSSFGSGGKLTVPADVTFSAAAPASGTLAPQAVHIGDLFLHAFGALQDDGRLVVGSSADTTSPTSSSLRRLIAPGAGSLGAFGNLPAEADLPAGNRVLRFVDDAGANVTLSLKGGGLCQATYSNGQVNLNITGAQATSVLSIRAHGPQLLLGDIRSDGPIRQISAPTADLAGTLSIAGTAGKLVLGGVTGVIAVSGAIGSLTIGGNVSGAKILSGADLGSDGQIGGTGAASDLFAVGSIGAIRISGSVSSSVIAAGLRPATDSNAGISSFLGSGATVIGGSSSNIGSIVVRGGVDLESRFVAGVFSRARIPSSVDIGSDVRFETL